MVDLSEVMQSLGRIEQKIDSNIGFQKEINTTINERLAGYSNRIRALENFKTGTRWVVTVVSAIVSIIVSVVGWFFNK